MNEAGPIAVFDEALRGFVALQAQLHIEILDAHGKPLPDGERGEITLTGGFNFCLPLLRYRTGDYGEFVASEKGNVVRNLSGRPPVRFKHADGSWRNNNDLTHQLKGVPLVQYNVHQRLDGTLILRYLGHRTDAERAAAIGSYLEQRVALEELPTSGTKVIQYTTDITQISHTTDTAETTD